MIQTAMLPDSILPLEPWFSPAVRARLAGRTIDLATTPALRRALRVPTVISVSENAEKHRRVTAVDADPGPWRPDLVPHAQKVMDTYGLPWVEEVWFCAVERAAKTNIMLNCLAWAIRCDPGNAFVLSPTELDSGKIVSKKIIPMLQASPGLSRYLSHRMDDTAKTLIGLNHGMSIFPAHANSASTMAAFYGKHCFAEEVDKYPPRTGREASPITLIRKRGRDRRGSKRMFSSTPAQQFVWKGVQECHQVWEYELCCPVCGGKFVPTQEHIVIGDGATAEAVERGESEVHLSCRLENCGTLLTEPEREAAYRWGLWIATKGASIERPAKVGFILPAWGLPAVPLTEIGAAILKARSGDLADKIALANGYAATDFADKLSDRKEDAILRLRDDRPAGMVPSEADALSLHVDTQDKGFWYTVRAWRFGLDLKSWLVKAGYVGSSRADDFTSIDAVRTAVYLDANGTPHHIMAGIVDTGGHRTSEVYAWCKATGILAARGAISRKTQPVTVGHIERFPGTNKPIPGGLKLYSLDTHYHKDILANKLQIDITDPGAWVLHSGLTFDQLATGARDQAHNLEEYARQMCVEYRDERNLWQCQNNKANHLWDCEQMALALAMYLGWQNAQRTDAEPIKPQRRIYSKGVRRD
jgi:phage terminase large subunit GpA-like protein